jgi:hypothetical protein
MTGHLPISITLESQQRVDGFGGRASFLRVAVIADVLIDQDGGVREVGRVGKDAEFGNRGFGKELSRDKSTRGKGKREAGADKP